MGVTYLKRIAPLLVAGYALSSLAVTIARTPIRRNKSPLDESLVSLQVIGIVIFVLAAVELSVWAWGGAALLVVASGIRLWHIRRFSREWNYWVVNENAR